MRSCAARPLGTGRNRRTFPEKRGRRDEEQIRLEQCPQLLGSRTQIVSQCLAASLADRVPRPLRSRRDGVVRDASGTTLPEVSPVPRPTRLGTTRVAGGRDRRSAGSRQTGRRHTLGPRGPGPRDRQRPGTDARRSHLGRTAAGTHRAPLPASSRARGLAQPSGFGSALVLVELRSRPLDEDPSGNRRTVADSRIAARSGTNAVAQTPHLFQATGRKKDDQPSRGRNLPQSTSRRAIRPRPASRPILPRQTNGRFGDRSSHQTLPQTGPRIPRPHPRLRPPQPQFGGRSDDFTKNTQYKKEVATWLMPKCQVTLFRNWPNGIVFVTRTGHGQFRNSEVPDPFMRERLSPAIRTLRPAAPDRRSCEHRA